MKTIMNMFNFREMIRSEELKLNIIFLASTILLALHRYYGSMNFARSNFLLFSDANAALYMFITTFIIMGLIPFLTVIIIFKEPPKEYGLQFGDWKTGIKATLVLFPVIALLLLLPASQTSEMRSFYPYDKEMASSVLSFLKIQFSRGIFFYTAWEFFFRGFILFGLRKYVGDWQAICIQTIPSALWHIGLPSGELFSSIPAGILFGILAIKTKSIFWPFLLHFLIGIVLDLFIVIL